MQFASKYVHFRGEEEEEEEVINENDIDTGFHQTVSSTPSPLSVAPQQAAATPHAMGVAFAKAKKKATPTRMASRASRTYRIRRPDTNVMCLELRMLDDNAPLMTGDPCFCSQCQATLNHLSALRAHDDGATATATTATTDTATATTTPTPAEGDREWICEFCGTRNPITLDAEEIPSTETADYLLTPAPVASMAGGASGCGCVIFCLDTSGSMGVTTEVQGSFQLKGAAARRLEEMRSQHGGGFDQFLPRQPRRTTYVSRLQALQNAIDGQLEQLAGTAPDTPVALLTFSSEVVLHGDGGGGSGAASQTIAGDRLGNLDALHALGKRHTFLTRTISETRAALSEKLWALEEGGQTALGPALVTAIGLASQTRGSKVILCTDGLANIGLGSLEDLVTDEQQEEKEAFYRRLGDMAAAAGTTVSILSLQGTECSMENLGGIADQTGGEVDRVDPMEIGTQFSAILANPVIATQVDVRIMLHQGLAFRDEEADAKGCLLDRHVGNVTADSTFTFEFTKRPGWVPPADLAVVPFQVQIRYTKRDGSRCIRVQTKGQSVATTREAAEQEGVDFRILSINSVQKSAKMAQHAGDYLGARLWGFSNARYMQRLGTRNTTEAQRGAYQNFVTATSALDHQLQEEQEREMDQGIHLDDEAAMAPPPPRRMSRLSAAPSAAASLEVTTPMSAAPLSAAPPAPPQRHRARKSKRSDETSSVLFQCKNRIGSLFRKS